MLSTEELFEYFEKVEEENTAFQKVIAFDEANACSGNYGSQAYTSERSALLEQFRLAQTAVENCREKGICIF